MQSNKSITKPPNNEPFPPSCNDPVVVVGLVLHSKTTALHSQSSIPQTKNHNMRSQQQQQSSSSSNANAVVTINTEKIRHALRLVHCIQKERGSSCAYYANNALFETPMSKARADSDTSSKLMRPYTDLPIGSSLSKIRSLIDDHKNPRDPANDLIFHRIFVCFNTLISSVVHECVLKHLSDDNNESAKGRGSSSSSSSNSNSDNGNNDKNAPPKNGHGRRLSSDINNHLSSNLWATMATPERITDFRKTFAFNNNDTVDDEAEVQQVDVTKAPPPQDNERYSGNDDDATAPVPPPPSPADQAVQELLDLLKLFVQLKESAGVERAILSSLLAFRNCPGNDHDDSHTLDPSPQ